MELIRQLTGNNNGHLQLSSAWLESRGWKSRDVVQRAKAELMARQLIIETRKGGLNIGPSRYAVTWLSISNFVGLEIELKGYHKGAWALMDGLPKGRKIAAGVPPRGKGNTA